MLTFLACEIQTEDALSANFRLKKCKKQNGDSVVSRRFCECNRLIANYLAESAAIGAVEAESTAIVSTAIDVESIDIDVESIIVVSVVSVFFWQAVAKETIAITKRADFAKFFMIIGSLTFMINTILNTQPGNR